MEFLGKDYLKRQTFVHAITEAGEWETPPFEGKDYACLLVLGGNAGSPEVYQPVARRLIATRCRYFVYYGADSDIWWDEVAEANRDTQEYDSPNEILVMENRHEQDDPLEDVLYSLFSLCDYEDVTIENFLILFIGVGRDVQSEIVKAAKERQ